MAIAKSIDDDISTIVLIFFRNFFSLLFIIFSIKKHHIKVKNIQYKKLHLLRIVISLGAMFCTYYTYRNLPVAFATALGMTGPLFTTVLSLIFFNYHVNKFTWISILVGYVGVICILNPGEISFSWSILTSILANILVACNMHITKLLSKHVNTSTIILYNSLAITFFTAILGIPFWQNINFKNLSLLFIISVLAFWKNYTTIQAIKYTYPAFVAPFEYSRLLFGIIIGWLCFQEIPTMYTIIGSVIIIISTYILTRYGKQQLSF